MSAALKSFDGSPAKAFIRSPCKARNNPGIFNPNLGVLFVNAFMPFTGTLKYSFYGNVRSCWKRFLKVVVSEQVYDDAQTPSLTYSHDYTVTWNLYSADDTTIVSDVLNGQPSDDLTSWFFDITGGDGGHATLTVLGDTEDGYSFTWVDNNFPQIHGAFSAVYSDETMGHIPGGLKALLDDEQMDGPWPDANTISIRVAYAKTAGLPEDHFYNLEIDKRYDGHGAIITDRRLTPNFSPTPDFLGEAIAYNDFSTEIFLVPFGIYPHWAPADQSPDAFLGNWFTYGTKLITETGNQNYVSCAARKARVRWYDSKWTPSSSNWTWVFFVHNFEGDPFFGNCTNTFPDGFGIYEGAQIMSSDAIKKQAPSGYWYVEWTSPNRAYKIWLFATSKDPPYPK